MTEIERLWAECLAADFPAIRGDEVQGTDLVLLDASPLTSVANVQRRAGVMVRGMWLPEAELQQRLERLAASNRAP